MEYLLEDYLPYIKEKCSRIDIYPNTKTGVDIAYEYESKGIRIIPLFKLLPRTMIHVPHPKNVIRLVTDFAEGSNDVVLFTGIDAYLALLSVEERRDFFVGVRNMLEQNHVYAHLLISAAYFCDSVISNPKYEGAMQLIRFRGDTQDEELNITLISSEWVRNDAFKSVPVEAIQEMGNYIPFGSFTFKMDKRCIPKNNYGDVYVIHDANDALRRLYSIDSHFEEGQAAKLLSECNKENMSPERLLISRFGEENISCDKAPIRLNELKNDELWDLYVWMLKSKINKDTYLFKVLGYPVTKDNFLEEYIVNTAVRLLDDGNAAAFSEERARVIKQLSSVEPLIAKFVTETEDNQESVSFMNCGTTSEMEGLIRRAARYDLAIALPDTFDRVAPVLECYISPYFDYMGNKRLTEYFTKLRCFRIKDSIDKNFVSEAYEAEVPEEIQSRDEIISGYDDGETALLVVDGLGAEYYPLLLNMASRNNLKIQEKKIVSVNLPSSTKFNYIHWSSEHVLPSVRGIDNISHEGNAKYEKCGYEENLAGLFKIFNEKILTRVVEGLRNYKRVVVTADHGSSYLAVTAYKKGLSSSIDWENDPDDWRYASLPNEKEGKKGLEIVYRAEDGRTYYVVKGYNRLPKRGGKLYGLHGGATLEERLVPFVVFTNEEMTETDATEILESQFIENDDFDI